MTQHVYCVTGQWRHTRSGSRGRQRCECAHTCAAQHLESPSLPRDVSTLLIPVGTSTMNANHESLTSPRTESAVTLPAATPNLGARHEDHLATSSG